ncbi:MAG: hypothetical protein ABIO63_04835 [Casimicrobiaceae bacterium]
MKHLSSMALAALIATGVATAQTASPPAAPAASAPVLSGANCPKPDAHPGRLASDNQRRGWGKEVTTWETCMKKYVAEVSAKADEAVKNANAAVARSNAAVNEYNAIVKDLQAQQDASVK